MGKMFASGKLGGRLLAASQVAGVVAAAWFLYTTVVLPRIGRHPIRALAVEALLYVLLAWMCGAALALSVYLTVSADDEGRIAVLSIRSSAPAMWFAPAIVLLSAPMLAASLISLFLIANATRQLIAQWSIAVSSTAPAPARSAQSLRFAGTATGPLPLPVLMGAFAAQSGLVAKLWNHPLSAAVLFALSMAILTSLAVSTGAYHPEEPAALPHSALSIIWIFLLATALTVGGVSASGPRGASGALSAGHTAAAPATSPTAGEWSASGDFPGVVLLPPLKPNALLMVPAPVPPGLFMTPLARPFGIPFTGEYWMFRWPSHGPPPGAILRRGSPIEMSFHTPDGWPMEMEARQRLQAPVAVRCCRFIEIDVQNGDRDVRTASLLEMILIDNSSANSSLPLGTPQVAPASQSSEVLTYRLPAARAFTTFNEIKLVFHRDLPRRDKSARISIERFVLLP